ncbi:hypothetical protein [Treponema primitia]|uniref:hypothetical protein n=1 Tax=Treponema primitia TaxID=88058 RepID=UPI00025557A8|nr:hypothetical protein [Treponema primitia]
MKNTLKPQICFLICVILLVLSPCLYAQNAAEIDIILETPEVNLSQATRFVLTASEALPEMVDPRSGESAAFAAALANGWLPKGASADRPIKLGELSFLIMKAFNMKGNLLYALFPGPRYSYRELQYQRILPEPGDPRMRVNGVQFLQIVERVLHSLEIGGKTAYEAETERIRTETRAEGRALNRRVEITLLNQD